MRKPGFWNKLSLVCVVGLFLSLHLNGWIILNGGPNFFESKDTVLEEEVVTGASAYLAGYGKVLDLLRAYEQSDRYPLSMENWQQLIDAALKDFRMARSTYAGIGDLLASRPYNRVLIDRLMVFDYENFAMSRMADPGIFDRLRDHLQRGDVRAVFSQVSFAVSDLVAALEVVRGEVMTGERPRVALLWRMNQLCCETMLYGQYAAEIFCFLSGK